MNKIIQMLRDGMQQRLLVEGDTTPLIPAGQTLFYDLPLTVERMLLKSLEVTCNKQTDFRVEFFEEPGRTNSRYNSGNINSEVYDVFDLPYWDQAGAKKMYFSITNLGDFEASYAIEIRGLELK